MKRKTEMIHVPVDERLKAMLMSEAASVGQTLASYVRNVVEGRQARLGWNRTTEAANRG